MAGHLKLDFIDSLTVAKLLKWEELIPAVERAMKNFSDKKNGGVVQPVRVTIPVDENGIKLVMPCYTKNEGALATKILTAFDGNEKHGLPTHTSLILYFDYATGIPKALMDGDVVTAMRTAAATVVATKHLLAQKPKILAILGAGVQGKSHYQAFNYSFQLTEVRIWNRTYEKAIRLVEDIIQSEEMANSVVRAYEKASDAVADADVIATVTNSSTPLLKADWVKPGALVNVVGANRPTYQEVDSKLMNISTVYVDTIEAALKESGDIIKNNVKIVGEVGDVIGGSKTVTSKGIIVCKLMGMAVEDAVSAKLIYDNFVKTKSQTK